MRSQHKIDLKKSFNFWRGIAKPPESSEYRKWRDRFLQKRFKFCLWFAFPCTLTYTLHDLYDADFDFSNSWVESNFFALFILSVSSLLYVTKWGKNNPKWVFLFTSLGLTFLRDFWTIYREAPTPSAINLNMVFVTQMVVVPFFWGWHLISQLLGVSSYFLSVRVRGSLPNLMLYENLSLIYWFWICFICTCAVYFYERLQRQEFESRRELNIFLHSISHDLRAPVMGTSMVLQNLLQRSENSPRMAIDRSIAERLLQGSDRSLKMIDSLLEVQNTATKGIILNTQACNLNCLVNSIILELQPILVENGAIVQNRITENLPTIEADSLQLWRVFHNLITNALKHNPYGIEIIIDAVVEIDRLQIFIIDNGIGIPPAQQQKLFELYTRGDRARYMPGLGIGLYLCRQIIIAHGGEIGCDSHPQEGTTFWFTLPNPIATPSPQPKRDR